MSSSPYIPQQLNKYLTSHKLQQTINTSINKILRQQPLPEDPYSNLISILASHATLDVQIKSVKFYQVLNADAMPMIRADTVVGYMGAQRGIGVMETIGILGDQGVVYDGDRFGGKGLGKCVEMANQVVQRVFQYKCTAQGEIDRTLEAVITEKGANWQHCVSLISYLIPKIQSLVLSKPLYSIYSSLSDPDKKSPQPQIPSPYVLVHCLQGGKAIGSKCKVTKYMIISKEGSTKKDPYLALQILAAIRKSIVGGKGGEAALKFSPDGTFVCPVDTIMDNLKIVEDAINAANAKEWFGIGLNWAADTLFSPDSKKYQLQNPKTPFDNDQMIDYLIKLCTDKPIICYLEDPLAATQLAAWKKLKTKLNEAPSLKDVKIGSRNEKLLPFSSTPFSQQPLKKALATLSIPCTADSNPQLTPQQITTTNSTKFSLDFFQLKHLQAKSVSNILKISKTLSKTNTKLILQDNFYETTDSSLIDLCGSIGAYVGLGSINGNRIQRINKFNRIKEINQGIGNLAIKQKEAN